MIQQKMTKIGTFENKAKSNHSKICNYLLVRFFLIIFFNPFFPIVYHKLNPYKKVLRWNHNKKCIWMLMQNPNNSPCVHFQSPLLYDWCIFIEFHPLINILIKLAILIHKYFCQIDDFTMHLWHLNRIHFVKSL